MAIGCGAGAVEPAAETAAAEHVGAEPSNSAAASTPVALTPAPLDVESLRGAWRSASAPPGYLSYRFDGNGYTADGYPPWQESGRVEVVAVEGRRLLLRFVSRIYDGKPDDDQERWLALAADGRSFEMAGRSFSRLRYQAAVAIDPPASKDGGSDGAATGEGGSHSEQLLEQ